MKNNDRSKTLNRLTIFIIIILLSYYFSGAHIKDDQEKLQDSSNQNNTTVETVDIRSIIKDSDDYNLYMDNFISATETLI